MAALTAGTATPEQIRQLFRNFQLDRKVIWLQRHPSSTIHANNWLIVQSLSLLVRHIFVSSS